MIAKSLSEPEQRINSIKRVGRATETFQIIVLAVMGQNIHSGGAQQLRGKHWEPVTRFFGGYQHVGLSLFVIASIGLLGLFSLAVTKTDTAYKVLMWIFSLSATGWFWFIGCWHGWAALNIPGAGNTGFWTLGLAGGFFLFSRLAISIGTNPYHKEF